MANHTRYSHFFASNFTPTILATSYDAPLSTFIEEKIPNSELINSNFVTHSVQLLDPTDGRTKSINEKINFSVYTFQRTDHTEPMYDTVIDYYFTEPMKVKKHDRLEVQIGDYLRPVSPISSIMLTKKTENESWELLKEPTAIMSTLQSFTLEGDELTNSGPYSRVIIHFSSYSNPDFIQYDEPRYEISYLHDSSIYFNISKIQGISIVVIVALGLYFIVRKKTRSEL